MKFRWMGSMFCICCVQLSEAWRAKNERINMKREKWRRKTRRKKYVRNDKDYLLMRMCMRVCIRLWMYGRRRIWMVLFFCSFTFICAQLDDKMLIYWVCTHWQRCFTIFRGEDEDKKMHMLCFSLARRLFPSSFECINHSSHVEMLRTINDQEHLCTTEW